MNNKDLAQKSRVLRNRKGYSQEELAEKTGLSLRTIQRIENGEAEPRGDSLKRLAIVFDVLPDEIVDWTVQEDKGFLVALNLSAMAFLIFPILGILVPLIFWISKKDKIRNLNEIAKDLLNFQITWTIAFFVAYMLIIISTVFKVYHAFDSNLISSMLFSIMILIGIMYLFNFAFIIINAIRVNNGKTVNYFPKIHFLKK
jgi:uncharacterized Tic20 family protein